MLRASLAADTDALMGIRREWDELLNRSRSASVFQTWEWLVTHWQMHCSGKQLFLVTVRDDRRLVALAPLCIGGMHGLPMRRLQFIGNGISDYQDFIVDSDYEDSAPAAIVNLLQRSRGRWDLMEFGQVPSDSASISALRDLAAGLGWQTDVRDYVVCPYLTLPGSWEALTPLLGRHTAKNVAYKGRLLARETDAEFCELGGDQIGDGMDTLFRLHTDMWNQRGLPGALADEQIRAFHREVSRLFAERDWLRLYGLRIGGEIRSLHYCFSYRERMYGYIGGWDPQLARYGVGLLLTAHVVKEAMRRRMQEVDFLAGDEEYKAHWTTTKRQTCRVHVHYATARSRAAHIVLHMEHRVGSRTRRLFSRCALALAQLAPHLQSCAPRDA